MMDTDVKRQYIDVPKQVGVNVCGVYAVNIAWEIIKMFPQVRNVCKCLLNTCCIYQRHNEMYIKTVCLCMGLWQIQRMKMLNIEV